MFLRQNYILRPPTGRPGLSQGGRASHREEGPLTVRPGLLQGGRAYYREAGRVTGRQSLSKAGRASYREVWPLTGRPGLSQSAHSIQLRARDDIPDTNICLTNFRVNSSTVAMSLWLLTYVKRSRRVALKPKTKGYTCFGLMNVLTIINPSSPLDI